MRSFHSTVFMNEHPFTLVREGMSLTQAEALSVLAVGGDFLLLQRLFPLVEGLQTRAIVSLLVSDADGTLSREACASITPTHQDSPRAHACDPLAV
jgi:hypothetical protein